MHIRRSKRMHVPCITTQETSPSTCTSNHSLDTESRMTITVSNALTPIRQIAHHNYNDLPPSPSLGVTITDATEIQLPALPPRKLHLPLAPPIILPIKSIFHILMPLPAQGPRKMPPTRKFYLSHKRPPKVSLNLNIHST